MNKNNSLFAANIKFLRKRMGMTQSEFAELLGATRGQIVSYEISESKPKGKIESEIISKFKISREQLYDIELNNGTIGNKPAHPVTLEKRIEKLENQVELLLKLLKDLIK